MREPAFEKDPATMTVLVFALDLMLLTVTFDPVFADAVVSYYHDCYKG